MSDFIFLRDKFIPSLSSEEDQTPIQKKQADQTKFITSLVNLLGISKQKQSKKLKLKKKTVKIKKVSFRNDRLSTLSQAKTYEQRKESVLKRMSKFREVPVKRKISRKASRKFFQTRKINANPTKIQTLDRRSVLLSKTNESFKNKMNTITGHKPSRFKSFDKTDSSLFRTLTDQINCEDKSRQINTGLLTAYHKATKSIDSYKHYKKIKENIGKIPEEYDSTTLERKNKAVFGHSKYKIFINPDQRTILDQTSKIDKIEEEAVFRYQSMIKKSFGIDKGDGWYTSGNKDWREITRKTGRYRNRHLMVERIVTDIDTKRDAMEKKISAIL